MIRDIISQYFKSFDNSENGYSRKKLLATFLIINGVLIEWMFPNAPMTNIYATLNFATGTTLLGIGAYQKNQADKLNSNNSNNQNQETK